MTAGGELEPRSTSLFGSQDVALVDLLDRLLAGGVVLVGDVTISLAGVDLVRISLRALVTSIAPVQRRGTLDARAEAARTIDAPSASVDRLRPGPGDA